VLVHFGRRIVLIGGTRYAGEIKKSVFTIMNYLMPLRGVLSMHCSANVGQSGRQSRSFSVSRARARRRCRPTRTARSIGDDEHGWSDNGVFNYRGRLLREGHQPVAESGAGDLGRVAPLRGRARERRARPGDASSST
jgi:ATP-dependent phosphoenolpyruvate carboxykinase